MTLMSMEPYEPQHFLDIELSESAADARIGLSSEKTAEIHKKAGPAWTFRTPDRELIFLLGVHDLWKGVGEIWTTTSPAAKNHPHSYWAGCCTVRWLMRSYWRLQAAVNPARDGAERLVRHFGFSFEGIMRRYGPQGEDFAMYALVSEEKRDG